MLAFLLNVYLGVKLLVLKVCKYSMLLDTTKEFSEALKPNPFLLAKY